MFDFDFTKIIIKVIFLVLISAKDKKVYNCTIKYKNQKVHKERRITKRTKIIRVRANLKILFEKNIAEKIWCRNIEWSTN